MPKLVPPVMPPNRVAEARRIATAGRWFVNCPEMRCRGANACRGPLRRFSEGGPRCYPDCLKLALSVMLAPAAASDAAIESVRLLLENDTELWDDLETEGGPISAAGALLEVMTILAEPAAGEGGSRPA